MPSFKLPMVLPKSVPSPLGPVPVLIDPDLLDEGNLGEFNKLDRTITVQGELKPETSWVTFWHELMHLILYDSGVQYHLSPPAQETLCDAFGTYMTVAMQKGLIQVPVASLPPKKESK